MSASINVKNIQPVTENIHHVPAEIQYDGEANVKSYFESTIREESPGKLTASLRGRPLHGKIMEVPSGYTGLMVSEAKKSFTDQEERVLAAKQSFTSFNYWNLDAEPSDDDKLKKALLWMDVAKTLHEPVDSSDSQASLKSEVSM